jgi:hypothetical protein
MATPAYAYELITSRDERRRCCLIFGGRRCANPSEFWVGTNGIDDYTHVCGPHLGWVRREGDVVEPLFTEAS